MSIGQTPTEPKGDELGRDGLRSAALGGVRWLTAARVVLEVNQLAVVVVLARLVSPAEFGHAAIALIVQTLVVAIAGAGFGTPLIQRKTLRREHIAAAQCLVLIVGISLGVLIAATAPLVVEPALGEETAKLVQLASIIFLISPLGIVPHALLQRRLEFRKISAAEMIASVVTATASVTLAIAGLGGGAVVLGIVIGDIALYGLFFALAPPAFPRWHWREVREVFAFGGPTSLSSVLRSGFRNVDYAILGVIAGPAAVGFYWRAFQLGVEYQRKISGIMVQVALPLYSRATGMEDMRAVRERITRASATIIFPLLGTLVVTAPEMIPWVFGPSWTPAVVPTQILATAGLCAAAMSGFGALVLAVGKPRALLAWDAASFVAYVVTVYFCAQGGINTLCLGVSGVYLAQFAAAHVFLLRPLAGIPVRSAITDVLPALVGTVVLVAASLPVFESLQAAGAWPSLVVGASATAGLAAYAVCLRLGFRAAWSDFTLLIGRVLPLGRIRALAPGALGQRRKAVAAP